jgi:TatD DNase family protein
VIDSHAHVAMFPEAEWGEIVSRAASAGVGTVLVPATGRDDLEPVLRVALAHPEALVAAVGYHPHEARLLDDGAKRRLEQALGEPGVVAVGEIGLDYHYDHSPREDQRRAFAWQLALARERSLPVVLHHREAWDDFLTAVDACPGVAGVAHSFTEGARGVAEVVARDLHVGISGMVTFPKADNIRSAATAVPAGRLLLETDSPYLAPVPLRGSRNEPANVPLVAARVAALRALDVAALVRETDAAFEDLFRPRR